MPALKIGVYPCRHGGQKLVHGASKGVRPERRRDELAHDPGIESIAGETNAAVAEQILRLATALAHPGANVQQREIACAAAKVSDKDQFIVIESGLVGVRCRHWLHFEIN